MLFWKGPFRVKLGLPFILTFPSQCFHMLVPAWQCWVLACFIYLYFPWLYEIYLSYNTVQFWTLPVAQ